MLDRPKNAWILLELLIFYTLGFLALIVVFKPFRDGQGHSGWTIGDKAQAVAQVAALVQYAMVALCLAFGDDIPAAVEGFVIMGTLGAIVFPFVYMYQLDKKANDKTASKGKKNLDKNAAVFENPVADDSDPKNGKKKTQKQKQKQNKKNNKNDNKGDK
jgi:hypothetical protein